MAHDQTKLRYGNCLRYLGLKQSKKKVAPSLEQFSPVVDNTSATVIFDGSNNCKRNGVGDNCLIAANVQIIDSNGHDVSFSDLNKRLECSSNGRKISIGDYVWIRANSFILPGVTIGRGAVISANSVVKDDVPEMCIVSGNPAKIVDFKKR